MRIGVLGASNCILTGNFVDIIRASERVTCVDNISLGGSTSVLLPYAAMHHDLVNYDLIIVDFMINEYTETKAGTYTTALGMKMMRTILKPLRAAGVPICFTIMPHLQALAQDEIDFLKLYEELLMRWDAASLT